MGGRGELSETFHHLFGAQRAEVSIENEEVSVSAAT